MNNIYLIGMMGSGKSVTAKALAAELDMLYKDLDEIIEKKTGRSITDIFKLDGEEAFRELETRSLIEITSLKNTVIATGGGVVLKSENVGLMKDSGIIVFLETGLETLWERVKHKSDRPLLNGPEPKLKLTAILKERQSIYEKVADIKVPTDGKTAQQVAKLILKHIL